MAKTRFGHLADQYGEKALAVRLTEAGISPDAIATLSVAAQHAIGQQLRLALQINGREQGRRDDILQDTFAVHMRSDFVE